VKKVVRKGAWALEIVYRYLLPLLIFELAIADQRVIMAGRAVVKMGVILRVLLKRPIQVNLGLHM
jgi:hypothetical protein